MIQRDVPPKDTRPLRSASKQALGSPFVSRRPRLNPWQNVRAHQGEPTTTEPAQRSARRAMTMASAACSAYCYKTLLFRPPKFHRSVSASPRCASNHRRGGTIRGDRDPCSSRPGPQS